MGEEEDFSVQIVSTKNIWDNVRTHQRLRGDLLNLFNKYECFKLFMLDVGCGKGYWSQFFPNYVGIDVDLTNLKNIKRLILRADARHLPFRDKIFSLIISLEVLEHIKNWKKALEKIIRVSPKWMISTPMKKYGIFTKKNKKGTWNFTALAIERVWGSSVRLESVDSIFKVTRHIWVHDFNR